MAGAVDKGKFRSGIGIEQVHQTGSAELQYSEVGTQSLPDVPPVVLVDVQPGAQDLESLLNEYRDRATKIARWQALLQETTDPGMRDYLQGLIDSERATLDTIARNAKDAGASEQELAEIEVSSTTPSGTRRHSTSFEGTRAIPLLDVIRSSDLRGNGTRGENPRPGDRSGYSGSAAGWEARKGVRSISQ